MASYFVSRNTKKLWLILGIAGGFFILLGVTASAQSDCVETFSWIPNIESNIIGYKIYYGQANGGPYPNVVYVGNPEPVDGRIQGTVTGLTCGETYYFVCVAVNDIGLESLYSEQVAVPSDSNVPGAPVNLKIIK